VSSDEGITMTKPSTAAPMLLHARGARNKMIRRARKFSDVGEPDFTMVSNSSPDSFFDLEVVGRKTTLSSL
jgi:hypothetical protein